MQTRRCASKSRSFHPHDVQIPMLPGNNFHDDPICRASHYKSHTLGMEKALASSGAHQQTFSFAETFDTQQSLNRPGFHARVSMKNVERNKQPMDLVPPVLRFLAFFKETVTESPHREIIRVRKVSIVYHTEDSTMLIREARQVNSGLEQGVIARRQIVYKPDSLDDAQQGNPKFHTFQADDEMKTPYRPADFHIGAQVFCHGITYTIVDMDETARKFYGTTEAPLPWPEEDVYNAVTVPKQLTRKPKKQISTSDMDMRRQMEFSAVGILSKHHPDDVQAAQQFLRTDGQHHVLQFAAVWDNTGKLYGDWRRFVLRYYLENDTIELCEAREVNDGRDATTNKFISRMRVLKPEIKTPRVVDHQQDTFGLKLKSHYVTYRDLDIGATVTIHGRTFFLYDADQATRQWYEKECEKVLARPIDVTGPRSTNANASVVHVAPPYNGYGSDEDSLQNWRYIVLRPPKVDHEKLQQDDGKVMRFRAELHFGEYQDEDGVLQHMKTPVEDHMRNFVLNYYCATNEVEIIEMPVRNSGRISGKFLAKGKHGVKWSPDQFYEGAIVEVRSHQFLLLEMDEASRKVMEGCTNPPSLDRLRVLLPMLRTLTEQSFYCPREAFRVAAPNGFVTAHSLQNYFRRCNTSITLAEAASILDFYTDKMSTAKVQKMQSDSDATVWDFATFRSAVEIPNSDDLDECANRAFGVDCVKIAPEASIEKAAKGNCVVSMNFEMKKICDDLRAKLSLRRGTFSETFRLLNNGNPKSLLTAQAFRSALVDVLNYKIHDKEVSILSEILFPPWREACPLTLTEFSDFMDSKEIFLKEKTVVR